MIRRSRYGRPEERMLRMNQVIVIRHKVMNEERSIRSVVKEIGVSRNTVRKYLQVSEPVREEKNLRKRPMLEKVGDRMNESLEEWKSRSTPK